MALALLAITLRDSVNLGSLIVAAAVGLGVIVTLLYGLRWKVEAQMREQTVMSLTEGRNAYKLAVERLGDEKDTALKEVGELAGKIAILEKLPHLDFEKQMELFDAAASKRTEQAAKGITDHIESTEERTIHAFEQHETRAQERHEAEMAVMERILNGKGPS